MVVNVGDLLKRHDVVALLVRGEQDYRGMRDLMMPDSSEGVSVE